ncbi:MAG: hypothetical protein RL722_1223 [Pseudomonadota bacterium]|jgi:SEC-C motif-containing protein
MKTRTRSVPATASGAPCPCGLPAAYADCCGRFHQADGVGNFPATPDAERLMRSRYSAYALGLMDYLRFTWHPSTRPHALEPEDSGLRWLGLEVRRCWASGPDEAWVEFVARCKHQGRAIRLHERSRFLCHQGRWFYVDGLEGKGS